MEEDTFMVAAAVLDPYTHYKLNLCNHTDYATSLTDAIAKILDPKSALSAIDEVSKFRECQGRFGTRLAEEAAARMEPSKTWSFSFRIFISFLFAILKISLVISCSPMVVSIWRGCSCIAEVCNENLLTMCLIKWV